MTPTELATAARRSYNANQSDPFFSDAQIYEWIYDAEMILATEAWVIKNVVETTTTAGTQAYAYPTNLIKVRRITYNGEVLDQITFREDDLLTGANQDITDQGTPISWFDFEDTIYLRPLPDSSTATLKIYGFFQPSGIPDATTVLETPDVYHPYIKLYCLQQMSVKDKNYEGARYYEREWEAAVQRAREYEEAKKRGSRLRIVQNIDVLPSPILGTV